MFSLVATFLGKKFNFDAHYLIKGGFWLGVGQASGMASIVILSIAFANLVSPDVYGTYKYILALAGILSVFTLPGMMTAVARAIARGDNSSIHRATRLRFTWSFLGALIAVCGASYYFLNGNNTLAAAFAIIAVALPFFDTFTNYNAYLTGKRDFKTQSFYYLLTQLISTTSLLLTLLVTDNVLYIITAYFAPLAVIRFLLYRLTIKKSSNENVDPEVIKYGKHLSLINVLGVASSYADTLLLWQVLGPQKVAIYALALAIPEQIKGPLKSISELAFPKFAAKTEEQMRKELPLLYRKLWLYAAGLFCVSVVYILCAPFIFTILFPQYLESVVYSQVFMLASIGLIGTIPISILSAQKKIKEQYIFSIVQPILQILMFIILIPFYGIWGAIAARVIMRGFYVSFSLYLLRNAFS